MTGAIDFLRKAKAICESVPVHHCKECPLDEICGEMGNMKEPADLIRKVMDYQIKEDKDAENA